MRASHRKAINCLRLKTHERNSDFCFVEEFAAINLNLESFSIWPRLSIWKSLPRRPNRSDLIIFTMVCFNRSFFFFCARREHSKGLELFITSHLRLRFARGSARQTPPKTLEPFNSLILRDQEAFRLNFSKTKPRTSTPFIHHQWLWITRLLGQPDGQLLTNSRDIKLFVGSLVKNSSRFLFEIDLQLRCAIFSLTRTPFLI